MAQKKGRLKILRQLLEKKAYDNQEDLLIDLEKEGFKTTQSTLSRDMRSMQVYRVYNAAGRAIYVLPTVGVANRVSQRRNRERLAQSFGFLSVEFSGNIAVLKTLNGYANTLAVEIDAHNHPDILGSLAGDDTLLLVLRESVSRDVVHGILKDLIPNYES